MSVSAGFLTASNRHSFLNNRITCIIKVYLFYSFIGLINILTINRLTICDWQDRTSTILVSRKKLFN